MTPSFAYPGGKHYLRNWISGFLPVSCRTYCEPCAGRGNVFWLATKIVQAERWVINDIATAEFFRLLKRLTPREIGVLVGTTYPTRADYLTLCANTTTERAIILEPLITFSGGGYGNGFRHEQPKAPTVIGYVERLKHASRILRSTDTEIVSSDWVAVCDSLGSGDFVYFDPPYMRGDVRAYSARFDFAAMIARLQAASFNWLLSEYVEPEYVAAFGVPDDTKSYRLKVSGSGESRAKVVTEALWAKF